MISIIVPVYNCSVSLEYSVYAIQQQTFSDWELTLVDDGSTDGCDILCDRFATGEYIIFCDGDDYLEKA